MIANLKSVWNKAQCRLPNRHRRLGEFFCHLLMKLGTKENFSFSEKCDQILVVIGSS
jgi:hypothetical protein